MTVDATTVGEALAALADIHPGVSESLESSDGKIPKFMNLYLNDEDVRYLDDLDTEVASGDVISILPAVAGGS